jgi:hypothetical protein
MYFDNKINFKKELFVMKKTFKDYQKGLETVGKDLGKPVYWFGELQDLTKASLPQIDNKNSEYRFIASDDVEAVYSFVAKDYTVYIGKNGKVISCFVVKDDKVQFGGLAAQTMFRVLNKLTGIAVSTIDSKYYQVAVGRKTTAASKQVLKSF